MKKIKNVKFILILSSFILMISSNAFAFESGGSKTHQYITQKSIEILKNDKNDEIYNKIKSYQSTLLTYCDWPDTYENDYYTYSGHFYDPDTGKNYLNNTSPTALTRFKKYTNAAIENFSSNENEAFKSLGKALHYFEDIHVPHHAANKVAYLTNHSEYESWVADHQEEFISQSSDKYNYLIDDLYTDFSSYSNDIFIDAAHKSKDNIDLALSSSESDMREAAENTVPSAQEIIAAYLYNFLLSQEGN